MSWFELDRILKNIDTKYKSELENTRLIMYSIFQSQSTKKLTPQDIIHFDWDKEQVENEVKNYDPKDALKIINKLNK